MWIGPQVQGAAWSAISAITNRYRLKERSPLMVTIMAMARGGLSSEVKGTSRFHSETAAASDGKADSCEYICPALRV